MTRIIVFFLMFLFVYFLGLQTNHLELNKSIYEKTYNQEEDTIEEDIFIFEDDIETLQLDEREGEHYTNKTASFLEKITRSIFNAIAMIFYKIANTFI